MAGSSSSAIAVTLGRVEDSSQDGGVVVEIRRVERAEREPEEVAERRRITQTRHVAVGALEDRCALDEESLVELRRGEAPGQPAPVVEPAITGV